MKHEFFSDVNEGRLSKIASKQIAETLKTFEGKRVKVSIARKYNQRSLQQNKYYWGVVVQMAREGMIDTWGELNTSIQDAHETLKANCNFKEKVDTSTGEISRQVLSTADESTMEFMEYIARCKQFLFTWFGMNVPEPNEQGEMFEDEQ